MSNRLGHAISGPSQVTTALGLLAGAVAMMPHDGSLGWLLAWLLLGLVAGYALSGST